MTKKCDICNSMGAEESKLLTEYVVKLTKDHTLSSMIQEISSFASNLHKRQGDRRCGIQQSACNVEHTGLCKSTTPCSSTGCSTCVGTFGTGLRKSTTPCSSTGCSTCVRTFGTGLCKSTTPCSSTPPHARKTRTFFCALDCISSTIFAHFACFKSYFQRQFACVIIAISCVLKPSNGVYRVKR